MILVATKFMNYECFHMRTSAAYEWKVSARSKADSCASSLLLSSLEFSDMTIYEP